MWPWLLSGVKKKKSQFQLQSHKTSCQTFSSCTGGGFTPESNTHDQRLDVSSVLCVLVCVLSALLNQAGNIRGFVTMETHTDSNSLLKRSSPVCTGAEPTPFLHNRCTPPRAHTHTHLVLTGRNLSSKVSHKFLLSVASCASERARSEARRGRR